jgi:putative Mg2+ transporter-C (MgtC) family protein
VRGLTTAASIWVTAAIGPAAGAGLPALAALGTGIYLAVALAFPLAVRRLPRSATAVSALRVRYPDGRGILRSVIAEATSRGFAIDDLSAEHIRAGRGPDGEHGQPRRAVVQMTLHVHGRQPVTDLAAALSEPPEVEAMLATDANAVDE